MLYRKTLMWEKEQVQQQGLVSKATQKAKKKKGEFNARAGNIAQLVKSLTHKHEGLSFKEPGIIVCIYNRAGKAKIVSGAC